MAYMLNSWNSFIQDPNHLSILSQNFQQNLLNWLKTWRILLDISITEVLQDFLIYISKERNFSNHTVSAYERDLEKFINYIKDMHHESFCDFHLIIGLYFLSRR